MKRVSIMVLFFLLIANMAVFANGQGDGGQSGDSFPEKDITLIVPWSAGGGTDTIARALAKNAPEYLGVNVNVLNQTGGTGAVGMSAAAAARPDGYTVGLITFSLSTYQLMGLSDLSYRDFELMQLLNQSLTALTVKADSKFETIGDVIKASQANPGSVTVGHSGAGGSYHLGCGALGIDYGFDFNYIPFDGTAPARSALLGGHIDIVASGIDEMLQLSEAGEVRILTVLNTVRHPLFPKVPTLAEAGYPVDNPILDWRGLGVPLGVPEDRLKILTAGFKKMFEDQEFIDFCKDVGLVLVYKDADGFEDFLVGMELALAPAIKAVGLSD